MSGLRLADFAANSAVQNVAPVLSCHDRNIFVDLLDIQDEKVVEILYEVAHDQMYDIFSSTLHTTSGGLQHFVGTDVDNSMQIHESPVDQGFAEHNSGN